MRGARRKLGSRDPTGKEMRWKRSEVRNVELRTSVECFRHAEIARKARDCGREDGRGRGSASM